MANELKNNFVYQLLLSSTQVLLPLATYPFITRVLGPQNLGKINYLDFAAQVFMIVAAFGIPFYGIREIARVKQDATRRSQLVKELFVLHAGLAIVCSILFLLAFRQKVAQEQAVGMLAVANILISSFAFEWFIVGMEQFKFAAIRTITIRILMLVACFTLVKDKDDYPVFFGIFTAAMLFTALLNAWQTFRQQVPVRAPLHLRTHLKPLFHFFLTASAIGIYEYVGTIILGHLVHNEIIVGYYTMMHKIVLVILAMLIAFNSVLIPRISFLASTGHQAIVEQYLHKFLQLLIAIGVPTCFGIFTFAPEIVQTVAGDQFLPAIPLLRILCFLPLAVGPTNIFCNQVLVSYHQEKKFMLVALMGCGVSIALNFLLVPTLSAEGSAWATLATETVIAIVSGYMAFQFAKMRVELDTLLKTILASLLFWPLAAWLRSIFNSPLLVLTSGVFLAGLLYLLLQMLLFKNQAMLNLMQYVSGMVKRDRLH